MTTSHAENDQARIAARLIDFIETELGFMEERAHLTADEPLIGGVLDSLDMIRLVRFIRDEFGVRVRDEDLIPDHFENVNTVAGYIQSRLVAE